MAQEIEIKLSLDPADIDTVRAHPLLCNLPVITQDLQNTYYDTPSLDLHAKRMALRFRKKGNQWLLTVKTAEASSEGLAVRNEWEVAAEPGIFNFQHVDRSAIRDFLETLTAQLIPIFTTHFTREIRLIQHGNTKIEMAIDQGHIESHGQRETLCEIELELLGGELADLTAFASQLQHSLPLTPSDLSKAARGYQAVTHREFRSKSS